MDNNTVYIFTEVVNCGKIGKIALDSFHKYHNHSVHVYGTKEDFTYLTPHKNNILIEVGDHILEGYKRGHIGTALLWEGVIRSCTDTYMLHFDSDVIFRANVIDEMIALTPQYDLIGPIRNYQHNPQNIRDVRHLADLCQTNCTLWNRTHISPRYLGRARVFAIPSLKTLLSLSFMQLARRTKWLIKNTFFSGKNKLSEFAQMIHGTYCPFPFRTIDFFDPVMFDMIQNGSKIYHLDPNEVGGCDFYGKRDNAFKEVNNFPTPYKIDFGSKLAHFSCVGSGMNFYLHPERRAGIGEHYVSCALDRYALFCRIFYHETLPGIPTDQYGAIININPWY